MGKYYRHFKGNIYRLLHEARHSETQEIMVVYQAMYGNNDIWVRPKAMFDEEITRDGMTFRRFTRISDEEALAEIPLEFNTNYHFPELDYSNELEPVNDDTSDFSPSAKAMITLLTSRGLVSEGLFDGFVNDDDIEKAALDRILSYSEGESLEDIFHLIQIWGGRAGRGIYIMDKEYSWMKIESFYKSLVDTCLDVSEIDEISIERMVKAVRDIDKSVKHFGIAFITKHTRFWLYRTLGRNALPIYDSIMANTVMRKPAVEGKHLGEFWRVMHKKSLQLNIDLMPLERQIFKYGFSQK